MSVFGYFGDCHLIFDFQHSEYVVLRTGIYLVRVFCHSWVWKYSLSFPPNLTVLFIMSFSCPFQSSPSGTQIMFLINPFDNVHRLDCKASSL